MSRLNTIILLLAVSSVGHAFGLSRALIKEDANDDSKFASDLATTWKKLADGKMVFDIDLNQEVEAGKKVNVAMVKHAIESRLKRKFEAQVTIVDNDTVEITYKGEDDKFLRKVAKTNIKPVGDVQIAAASTTSDGGIRAKVAARAPKKGEVKAKVLEIKGGIASVFVIDASKKGLPKEIRKNHTYEFKVSGAEVKKDDVWIFAVGGQDGTVWNVQTAQ